MAQSVDTRVVELKFNNDNFAEKVDSTLTKLQSLDKSIKEVGLGNALKNLGKDTKNVDFSGITNSVEEASKGFSKMEIFAVTALANISNSVVNLGKKLMSNLISPITQGGLTRAMNIEQAGFQFEGMNVMKSAGHENLSYYHEVMEAVLGTAYSYDVAAKAASQLAASNIGVEKATKKLADGSKIEAQVLNKDMTKALLGIAGVASMTGSDFDSIAQIFTRVAGQGRVMAMDLNSISARGLNAAAVLGGYLHKTEAEIRDMVSKGKISFQDFSDAMSEAYGSHAKDSTLMFTGALEDVKAALARIGADFYGPALTAARDLLNSFTPLVDVIHERLNPYLEDANNLIGQLADKGSKGLDFLSYALTSYFGGDKASNEWINDHIGSWTNLMDAYTKDGQAVYDVIHALYTEGIVIGDTTKKIRGFTMIADYLGMSLDDVKKGVLEGTIGFNDFYMAFKKLWSQSTELQSIEGISDAFNKYIIDSSSAAGKTNEFTRNLATFTKIFDGSKTIINAGKDIFVSLARIFMELATHLQPLGKLFVELVQDIAQFTVRVADFVTTNKTFQDITDSLISIITKFFEVIRLNTIATTILDGITKAFNFLATAVERVISGFTTVFGVVAKYFGIVADKVQAVFTEADLLQELFENLGKAGFIVVLLQIANYLMKPAELFETLAKAIGNVGKNISGLIDNISGIFKSISGMVGNIGDLIGELTTAVKRMQEVLIATAILEIALALGVLAGSLYLMSKVKGENIEELIPVLLSFGVFVGTFFMAVKKLGSVKSVRKIWEKAVNSIRDVGAAMIEMAAALAIIAAAVYALSTIETDKLWNAVAAIEILMLTMAAIAKFLSGTVTRDTGIKALWSGKETAQSMTKGMYGLIAMAGAIRILSSALVAVASVTDPVQLWSAVAVIEVMLGTLAVLVKWLSGDSAAKMTKGATTLLAMALAVKMLTQPIIEFASLDSDSLMQGVIAVGILMTAMAALTKLMSGNKGAVGASVGLLLTAAAIKVLSDVVVEFSSLDPDGLLKGVGVIIGLLIGLAVAIDMLDSKGVIGKAVGLLLIVASIKILQDTIMEFGTNAEQALNGLIVLAAALGVLFGAVFVFSKAPVAGILKLFVTLALGVVILAGFGAATILVGMGVNILAIGLQNLANTGNGLGIFVGIMITFVTAIGLLSAMGIVAIPVMLTLGAAFLMFGASVALVGVGMTAIANSIKILTDLSGAMNTTSIELVKFVDSLLGVGNNAKKVGENFELIAKPIETLGTNVEKINKHMASLKETFDGTLGAMTTNITSIATSLTTLASLNESSFAKATEAINNFIAGIKNMGNDATSVRISSELISSGLESVKVVFNDLNSIIDNFKKKSVNVFTDLGTGLDAVATPLTTLNDMQSSLKTLSAELVNFVNSLGIMKEKSELVREGGTEIATSLTQAGDAVKEANQNFNAFTENTAAIFTRIGDALTDIANGIAKIVQYNDSLPTAAASITTFYNSLFSLNATAGDLAQGTQVIASAITNLGTAAKKAASASAKNMTSSGQEMVTNIASGITKSQSKVIQAGNKAVTSSVQGIRGKRSSFYSAGSYLISGLVSGIRSQQGALEAQVQSLEAKAERALAAKAKIQSPSKVWMKLGAFLGEGLAIGIKNSESSVVSSSRGLAAVSEDAVSSAINAISEAINSDWDTNPVITPIVDLSNISRSASTINQAFGSNSLGSIYANRMAGSIGSQIQNGSKNTLNGALNSLTNQLGYMTDTMNSRSLNNYITVDGATNPEEFADELISSFKLNARTV